MYIHGSHILVISGFAFDTWKFVEKNTKNSQLGGKSETQKWPGAGIAKSRNTFRI